MPDLAPKHRLLLLAYIKETEPVPYALLVTLILSGLSMDYFQYQEALSGALDAGLITTIALSELDADKKPQVGYELTKNGEQVLASLEAQLNPKELQWLKENAPHYRAAYEADDLTSAHYRRIEEGYMVSLGQTKGGGFRAQYTFFVETEEEAKKAVARFRNRADGLNDYLKTTLLTD